MYGKRRFKSKRRYIRRTRRSTRRVRRIARGVVWKASETKYSFLAVSQSIPGGTTYVASWIDGISQGTTSTSRIGAQIMIKSMTANLRFFYNYNSLGTTLNALFRVCVFYPRKGVSTTQLTATMSTSVPGLNGWMDPNTAITLYDKWFAVGSQQANTSGSIPAVKHLKFRVRLKPLKLHYANDGILVDREPLIYIVSSIPVADASSNFVSGYLRTSFKDF